jgi:hypothetical protein
MPIEKFVDWLEGAYAGPIGPDQLSFPKIISGRIGDAALPRWE